MMCAGANYTQIPINCPYAARLLTHQRDGAMVVVRFVVRHFTSLNSRNVAQNGNSGSAPNYFPNTVQGATDSKDVPDATKVLAYIVLIKSESAMQVVLSGTAGHYKTAWKDQVRCDVM